MKNILVYNTDRLLSKSLKTFLEAKKYAVSLVQNLDEVEKIVLQKKMDLIIYNLSNPKLDPADALLKMRSNQLVNKCPVILISENGDLKQNGFKNFNHFQIPLNYNLLLNSIEGRLSENNNKPEAKKFSKDLKVSSLSELKEYILKTEEKCLVLKDQIIYKQHKNASYIYLIAEGLVKTYRMDEYGKELITGLYNDKELFGFYSFNNISIYPETAKALKNCNIYKFPIKLFQEILAKNNTITLEFAQILSDNVSILKSHMLDLAYASVLKKTTKTLLHCAVNVLGNPSEGINLSRSNLASIAGISTESLIRSLAILKKNNLISVQGRNIKVLDLKKLQYI